MTNAQTITRVDEILSLLPADTIAIQQCLRYGGAKDLQTKVSAAVDLLRQLKTDLGGKHAD